MFHISLIQDNERIIDGSVHATRDAAQAEFDMMRTVTANAARNYAGTFALTLIDADDNTLATFVA